MDRLVTKPSVYIAGQTVLNYEQLLQWCEDEGFDIDDLPAPLEQIFNNGHAGIVEFAGRHCYRSFSKGRPTKEYIRNIIDSSHGSVLEHFTVNFVFNGVSRTLSHELVRHRVGIAISQESQRYVDAKDIRFVVPPLYLWLAEDNLTSPMITKWATHCYDCLDGYNDMLHGLQDLTLQHQAGEKGMTLDSKRRTEAARSVLPGAAETRLVWTANIRTLRHFFEMRGGQAADLEIRRLACEVYDMMYQWDPEFMDFFFFDFVELPEELGVRILCRTSND